MNCNKFILRIFGILFSVLVLQSCDNGPDYGKMRPSRMDIAGAKSIGFIDGESGSRGEAVSSGLYKIDANGTISAVAVYFTEDDNGNKTKHEGEVRLQRANMYSAGNDYIYFGYCRFEDKSGESIEGLPSNILVRKSDGKMWSLDEESTGVAFASNPKDWQFFENENGTLYYYATSTSSAWGWGEAIDKIYKLNLKSEPATLEQVTDNVKISDPYSVDSKGIICGPVNSFGRYTTFAWPNSGFQGFSESVRERIVDYSELGEVRYNYDGEFSIVNFHGQYYAIQLCWSRSVNSGSGWKGVSLNELKKYPFLEFGICNKISFGDTPGSATIDQSETVSLKNDNDIAESYRGISSVLVTRDYILLSLLAYEFSYAPYRYRITALNPEKNEWKWIVETPEEIDFNKTYNYNNRYWSLCTIDGRLGAWWFNPNTHESGFVAYNTTLPSYVGLGNDCFYNGKVIYSGINPADSHKVKIAIDLMTGDAITDDQAPEYLFSTIISLN